MYHAVWLLWVKKAIIYGDLGAVKYFYFYLMSFDVFFQKIRTYTDLSPQAETAWGALLRKNTYHRGDYFITEGQTPKKVAFIVKGLFYQYYAADNGDMVVKYFFPENRASRSAPNSRMLCSFSCANASDEIALKR